MVVAGVTVASATTFEETDATGPVLIVLKCSIRPVKDDAVGRVTEIAEAELKITKVSVTGTV
jgi:hypothetical protein